jgi:carbon starvation protein CstA
MRTVPFILMLAVIGAVLAWQMRGLLSESPWYGLPVFAALIFAGLMHYFLRRPGTRARRHALLFGVGAVALLASLVFGTFVWSFISLLARGSWSFDPLWIVGALAAGALAAWLWFRFYRIVIHSS